MRFDLDLPDFDRLPRSVLLGLTAEAGRLSPLPEGPLPILDRWVILGGGAERLRLPLVAVAPERPAAKLLGTAWVQLGEHALGEDGEELAALLLGAQRWCDAVRRELRYGR